jgi:hypothetical protein
MLRSSLFCAASVLTVAAASLAFAQSSAAPAEEDNAIIVTAQLREQSIVDVPIAITALDGEFIERLGVSDFEEVSRRRRDRQLSGRTPERHVVQVAQLRADRSPHGRAKRVRQGRDGASNPP